MHSVLITWAPDAPENRRIVEALRGAFDAAEFTVAVRLAAETAVPDLALAALILFGVQKTGQAELPGEYAELARSLKGVTLAGRTAAVFSMGAERAAARLRKLLKDTEVSLRDDDPVFTDPKLGKHGEITDWARKISASL
jgi:hypothetical protein